MMFGARNLVVSQVRLCTVYFWIMNSMCLSIVIMRSFEIRPCNSWMFIGCWGPDSAMGSLHQASGVVRVESNYMFSAITKKNSFHLVIDMWFSPKLLWKKKKTNYVSHLQSSGWCLTPLIRTCFLWFMQDDQSGLKAPFNIQEPGFLRWRVICENCPTIQSS